MRAAPGGWGQIIINGKWKGFDTAPSPPHLPRSPQGGFSAMKLQHTSVILSELHYHPPFGKYIFMLKKSFFNEISPPHCCCFWDLQFIRHVVCICFLTIKLSGLCKLLPLISPDKWSQMMLII